jgi:membrane fusion protein, heavy metal efflux system
MTQSDPPNRQDDVPQAGSRAVATGFRSRGAVAAMVVIAALAGAGAYRLVSHSMLGSTWGSTWSSWGGPARAQDPGPRENPPQLVKDGERITVPPGSPLRGKLVIAAVAEKEIQRSLVLPAVVEADPARTVKVLPAVAGRVVELKVQLGTRVAKGDVLAVIESGDLAMAFSDAEKARAGLTLTKQALDRLLVLEKYAAISVKDRQQGQSDYAQAQAELQRTETRLRAIGVPEGSVEPTRLLSMKAPMAGSVIDLQMAPGAFLNDPTAVVSTIANLETIWVTANVPEKDTALVTKGQSVEVVFTAYPGEVFRGTVLFVSDVLDPDTRRTKVRIAFQNPDLRLKPNMFANATFLAPKRSLPVIPTNAILLRNETDQVFVEVEPWVFEARPVEVGFQQGDQAVVTGGLKAGERVVVKDGVLLND